MQIIGSVRENGHEYYLTIDDSVSVATALVEHAKDSKKLAEFLLDPTCKPQEIQEFISEMRNYAQESMRKSKRISSAFRKIRTGINEV
jgi:hypothetical protein